MKQLWTGLAIALGCIALVVALVVVAQEAEGSSAEVCLFRSLEVTACNKICFYTCSCGIMALNQHIGRVCPETAQFTSH